MTNKPRNFVKKHADLLLKPSRMRNRKKESKKSPKDYDDEFEYRATRRYRKTRWEYDNDDDESFDMD